MGPLTEQAWREEECRERAFLAEDREQRPCVGRWLHSRKGWVLVSLGEVVGAEAEEKGVGPVGPVMHRLVDYRENLNLISRQ